MIKTESTLLLSAMLSKPDLARSAIRRINGYPLFDAESDPEMGLIWSVIADFVRRTGAPPTLFLLQHELAARYSGMAGLSNVQDNAMLVMSALEGIPSDAVTEEVGEYLLTMLVQESHKEVWAEKAKNLRSEEDFKRFAKQVNNEMASVSGNIVEEDELADYPMMCPDRYLKKRKRTPLGMHFWDQMTGGGIAAGEVFGVLGPTGGGKTVLAVNLVINRALRGEAAHLYQYEQPVEGDIMERTLTRVLEMPISKFRDKGWEDLNEETTKRIKEKQLQLGRRVMIKDLSKGKLGSGGAEEIVQCVERAIKKGEPPTLVIIDWLGAMVDRYLSAQSMDKDNYPTIAGRFIERLNRMANEYKLGVIIFHQLNTQVTGKSECVKPKVTEAHMVKSFAYKVDSCFCLGNLHKETKVAWFIAGKNRRGNQEETLIKLDGDMQTFISAAGDYVADYRGKFVLAGNAVPDQAQDTGLAYA